MAVAVTKGHGNPDWNEDEVVLALDLYLELGGAMPASTDPRVLALSETLRSLPYHAEAARKPSFRNPDGVVFKIGNLRAVATGKGLGNTAKVDRLVWERFGNDPTETRARAAAIREAASLGQSLAAAPEEEDEVFPEGRTATYVHKKRERNPKLRKKLIAARTAANRLFCDICGLDSPSPDQKLAEAAFEAHHIVPLSSKGESTTKLGDLALLCACCHRMLHRAISLEKRWISIAEAKELIK